MSEVSSVVGLFGRQPESMSFLMTVVGTGGAARRLAEKWLTGRSAYLVVWRTDDGRAASLEADDRDTLLDEALPRALALGEAPERTLLMATTWTGLDDEADTWWARRGGMVRDSFLGAG